MTEPWEPLSGDARPSAPTSRRRRSRSGGRSCAAGSTGRSSRRPTVRVRTPCGGSGCSAWARRRRGPRRGRPRSSRRSTSRRARCSPTSTTSSPTSTPASSASGRELLGGHLAQRLETVQLVLQGAPIPEVRAGERLGYELAGRHVALVLWHEEEPVEQGTLERVAGQLARAAGARRAFTLPAGATTMWAWMSTSAAPDLEVLRAALAAEPGVRVAVGSRHGGMEGFRRSHQDALEVQRLVRRRPGAEHLTSYADVEVAVVASADPVRARRFVESTLGPLLHEREAVLRETLRVHLQEQASATRAARLLFTHRNTVLKRVARAEALLPCVWQERPLAVALALELDHWLTAADETG